jgi:hypothetical protein
MCEFHSNHNVGVDGRQVPEMVAALPGPGATPSCSCPAPRCVPSSH